MTPDPLRPGHISEREERRGKESEQRGEGENKGGGKDVVVTKGGKREGTNKNVVRCENRGGSRRSDRREYL